MVSRLLCSLRALRASPNLYPCSKDPARLRIVMVLDQNRPTTCMERRPVVFTIPIERRLKKTWGLPRQIQPRTALIISFHTVEGGLVPLFLFLLTVLFLLGEYLGSFCTKSHQSA